MRSPQSSLTTAWLIAAIAFGWPYPDASAFSAAPHRQSTSASRPGWVDVSSSGFTISLPTDMNVKDLSQADANELVERAKQRHSSDPKVLSALTKDAASGQLKMVATLKHTSASGFHNAVAVLVKPNMGSKTDDDVLKSNMASLEKISEPGSVSGKKITLPCGHAIRIQSNRLRPGGATTSNTTYLIIHDSQLYVFSFVSHLTDSQGWRAIAQSSMESLRFESRQ